MFVSALPVNAGDGTLISWASGVGGKVQPVKFAQEKLKYSPTLAYIPTYTGKAFLTTEAVHYTGLPTGDCYNVTYLMKENVDMVHSWYIEALKQTGWSIDDASYIGTAVSGVHANGMRCYVYVRPSAKAGYPAETMLRYSARK